MFSFPSMCMLEGYCNYWLPVVVGGGGEGRGGRGAAAAAAAARGQHQGQVERALQQSSKETLFSCLRIP